MTGFEATIAARYISAKYDNPSLETLEQLLSDARKEVREIIAAKEQVYIDYPGVHGRFQQSQLDVLDIREQKAAAVIQNVRKMINKNAAR